MEINQKAYECYKAACEKHGIEWVNFNHFIKHLTPEQLNQFIRTVN